MFGAADLARLGSIISLGMLVIEALGERAPGPNTLAQLTDLLFQSRGERSSDEAAALARVRSRASVADRARQRLHDAISAAAEDGYSLRQIGHAAGVSHERVRRILNESPPTP